MALSQTQDKFFLYNKKLQNFFIQSLRLRHLPPVDWKFLQIGTLRAKDLRKNVSVFQEGGSTPSPPTLLVIRVGLLHTLYGVSNPLIPQLYV